MIVYKGKLLKNNSDQKSKLVLSTLVTAWLSIHLWPILLQTLVAIKLESCQTSFPSFCTQPSEVAVLFNLNLSSQFKSAAFSALHRIQFGTCCFVPMSYFFSETNDWSKDGAKQWARLWSATTFHLFHQKFNFVWRKKLTRQSRCCLKITNH